MNISHVTQKKRKKTKELLLERVRSVLDILERLPSVILMSKVFPLDQELHPVVSLCLRLGLMSEDFLHLKLFLPINQQPWRWRLMRAIIEIWFQQRHMKDITNPP